MAQIDPLLQHQNIAIDDSTQQMLNQPLAHDGSLSAEDEQFLNMLMNKIEQKEINLYQPSTLINTSVYEKLNEESKGKADYDAFNMLGTVREIKNLWDIGQRNTYQIENLVHRLRVMKERLEEVGGDIFII